jgi:hypothetical protein
MAFPTYADRLTQDHRLAGLDEAEGGEVSDLGGADLWVGREVAVLDAHRLLEAGGLHAPGKPGGVATRRFVLAEDAEQFNMAEVVRSCPS